MKIKTIQVTAGRTFNHPYEQYSNLRPEVKIIADLQDGDDPDKCISDMQAKAEKSVEDHKTALLDSIESLQMLSMAQQRAHDLESTLKRATADLAEIRGKHPEIFQQNLLT